MKYDLDLVLGDSSSIALGGLEDLRRPSKMIDIGEGLSLSPPPIRSAGAIGHLDVVGLLLNVPLGISIHLAAMKLHEWACRRNIRKVRVNGVEVEVSGEAAEVVAAIARLLEAGRGDTQQDPSDAGRESEPE